MKTGSGIFLLLKYISDTTSHMLYFITAVCFCIKYVRMEVAYRPLPLVTGSMVRHVFNAVRDGIHFTVF